MSSDRKAGRWDRPFVGPFTMLQVVAVMVAVLLTALVLVFVCKQVRQAFHGLGAPLAQ